MTAPASGWATHCLGCGSPATARLVARYLYPRAVFEPGAVDPCHVAGSGPFATCGGAGCEAEGLLAVLDRVADGALKLSHQVLDRADIRIVGIEPPGGDFIWHTCGIREAA